MVRQGNCGMDYALTRCLLEPLEKDCSESFQTAE